MRKVPSIPTGEIKKLVRIVNARPFEERGKLLRQVSKRIGYSVSKTSRCLEIADDATLSKRFVGEIWRFYAPHVNRGILHPFDLSMAAQLLVLLRNWMIDFSPECIFNQLIDELHFSKSAAQKIKKVATSVSNGKTPKYRTCLIEDAVFEHCYNNTLMQPSDGWPTFQVGSSQSVFPIPPPSKPPVTLLCQSLMKTGAP